MINFFFLIVFPKILSQSRGGSSCHHHRTASFLNIWSACSLYGRLNVPCSTCQLVGVEVPISVMTILSYNCSCLPAPDVQSASTSSIRLQHVDAISHEHAQLQPPVPASVDPNRFRQTDFKRNTLSILVADSVLDSFFGAS
ncbi:hypothetical protein H4582DRAFT_1054295 [Lactarius indigo]|nr:hypothetical protein H4582DRAFT_1054295 [Lactarius indigo]